MIEPKIRIVEVKPVLCKNCGSGDVIKKTTRNGVPIYFCNACQRKFKGDDSAFHGKVDANMVKFGFGW